MTLPAQPTPGQYEAAYHGTGDEDGEDIYVCWDCATPRERNSPVTSNDPAGEVCERCEDVGWEIDEEASS